MDPLDAEGASEVSIREIADELGNRVSLASLVDEAGLAGDEKVAALLVE